MSTPTNGPETTDGLIARALASARPAGECPDPGLLAALHERRLDTDEAERWIGHVADCRRCQAQLAAIGRAEADVDPPAAAPAVVWWRRWRMLAPVGAISIIALAVWIADPGTTIDQQVAVENRSAPSRAQPERAAITGAEDGRRGAEADVAAAPGARPEAMPAMRRSVVTPDVAPRLESAQLAASALSNSVLVVSPEPQTRWRVGPDGSMERSIDGGATWTFQLDPTDRVIAGSAPSERVAWLVGENGLVLRTTDGAGWERTTAPVSTHLTGIEAVDALDATVDTPDGRRFRTVDGGASWVPLP